MGAIYSLLIHKITAKPSTIKNRYNSHNNRIFCIFNSHIIRSPQRNLKMKFTISQSKYRYKSNGNKNIQKSKSFSILLTIFATFAILTSYSINTANTPQTPSEKTSTLRIGNFSNIIFLFFLSVKTILNGYYYVYYI